MSGKKLGGFSTFDGATPPVSPAAEPETPAEPPAVKSAVVRQARPARTARSAEVPAEVDKNTRSLWRTALQNSARKLAADRLRLDESEQAWADTVTQARALGIPANVILAAAADADVELPE